MKFELGTREFQDRVRHDEPVIDHAARILADLSAMRTKRLDKVKIPLTAERRRLLEEARRGLR